MTIRSTVEREIDWKQIKDASLAGTARELIQSGDSIPIRLKTGEDVILDATYDANGKLYFVTHDCLNEERNMNNDTTNKGGWAATDLRKELNERIFDTLPDELQEIIVPTKIVQVIGEERVECADKLFCLSFTQAFGKVNRSFSKMEPEDTQLDIFKTERSRVKECGGNGTWFWWLRSPWAANTTIFAGVNSGGNGNNNSASSA